MTAALWDEIRELNRRLDAMLRAGSVQSVNGAEVVIEYPDGVPSPPMPYLASSAAFDATPTVGDQAFVFMPGGDPLMACALCGVSSTDRDSGNKAPPSRADKNKTALDKLQAALDAHTHSAFGSPPTSSPPTIPVGTDPEWDSDTDATKVKVD